MDWIRRWDIWGVIVGVLGIALAAYTYFATEKVGRISYSFDTQKVFDPGILSGFTLVGANGEPIKQVVYATDLVIWNSGDLSLSENSDRVREPIKISVDGTIHYFILNKLNIVPAENYTLEIAQDKKSLSIGWRYFDPPQGIRLTLIHSNSEMGKIAISGRFFDTSLVEQSSISPAKTKTNKIVATILIGLLGVIFAFTIWQKWNARRSGITLRFLDSFFPISTICVLLLQLVIFSGYFSHNPPV
jgi:hypothetical protein